MARAKAAYDEKSIKTLDALEHIRLRSGMYIGRLGDGSGPQDGIYVMLKEVVDNGIDEFIMGAGKRIEIKRSGDAVTIRDYGRGIPLGKLVDCVSQINTGGKYSDDVFQFSVGLNGVGTKAVNALSQRFSVTSWREGKFRRATFARGKLQSDKSGKDEDAREGTEVSFEPDPEIFGRFGWNEEFIADRLRYYAFLNAGLTLEYQGKRFHSSGGLSDLLAHEMGGEEPLYPLVHERVERLEFAFTHTHAYGETYYSFVNGQYTNDGGTHQSAFREGVLKAVNEFSGKSFAGEDVRDGIVGAVAIKIQDPLFDSQTKTKLGSDVRGWIVPAVKDRVVRWLHAHKEEAEKLLEKVRQNERVRKELNAVKKDARERAKKVAIRIPKLTDCRQHFDNPKAKRREESTIFLTEGDSAGGVMIQSRDVETQAVFSLRGKPLNCHGLQRDAIYKNEELYNLMRALGIEDGIEGLRYAKVVLATDADVDGMHIRNLLLTYFLRYFEELVIKGHVYILETPLFRVRTKKETRYCYSEAERDAAMAALRGNEVTRFKGLGEISPHEFGQFIGEHIQLAPVLVGGIGEIAKSLEFYMGKNTPERRAFLVDHLSTDVVLESPGMTRLDAVMRRNFVDYASYAILDRAIPDLRDGLKPVQRRILHTLFEMHDGRYHKVANVIGESMKLHPHGDASIGDALVVLANKELFIDRQGNFGNLLTGHPSAAPRYIECRLTPLALEALFNEHLTEFVPSYDGRNREPVFLPTKLPMLLMLGADGIAVGMATRILPHNIVELWEAQIACLNGKTVALYPDFPQGGRMDVAEYDDGRGKVAVRAVLDAPDPKRVVIREVPYGTTTESLVASIESAIQRGRVQISSINDYTTDKVEIELELPRGVRADDVIPQLYAYTDCAVAVNSNLTVVRDRKPVEMTVTEVLRELTDQLRERLRAELVWEQNQLTDRKHWITLERIFVEHKVYRGIETATTEESVKDKVWSGMRKHERLFVRPMTDEDVARLLELRIRRISAWDLDKSRAEEAAIDKKLKEVAKKLRDMKGTSIAYLKDLIDRYGKHYKRRTKITSFTEIDKKAVARPTLKVAYDPATGYFGTHVKGDAFSQAVSEYDLLLTIADDGTYRILPPPEKLLFTGKLLHCQVFDPEKGAAFTVIYRDKQRFAFGKRVHIQRFIRAREYTLIKDKAGKVDMLLPSHLTGTLHLKFAAMKRQRVHEATFDLADLEVTGTAARGTRLASKPVAQVKLVAKPTPPPKGGGGGKGEQATLF